MGSPNCKVCGSSTKRDGKTGRYPDYCSVDCRRRMELKRKSMEKQHAKLTERLLQLQRQEAGPMANVRDGETLLTTSELIDVIEQQISDIEQSFAST